MSGVIVDGWSYVYAAYGVTLGAFALYSLSLFLRLRSAAAPPPEHTQE